MRSRIASLPIHPTLGNRITSVCVTQDIVLLIERYTSLVETPMSQVNGMPLLVERGLGYSPSGELSCITSF